jgi:hypothetical protein
MTRPLTAGVWRRRGNPGTKGRLLEKSVEAYLLALETINRLTITYRVETFCTLVCNAWELLLKAKVIEDTGRRQAIYRPKQRGKRRRSIKLSDAVKAVFPDERDHKRRNLERVEDLRNEAVHLFLSEVPKDVLELLQANVLNYHACLNEWFDISLSERVPVGMMTIVFDTSPERLDLSSAVMRRRLGKEATEYLLSLTEEIRAEHEELDRSPEYAAQIEYKLAIEKKADKAAAVAVSSGAGRAARIGKAARDPGDDYEYRQKELVEKLNDMLTPERRITTADVQAVSAAHKVKARNEWFFKSKIEGSPGTYSQGFADWFAGRYRSDPDFLSKAREKRRKLQAAARAAREARRAEASEAGRAG